MNRYVRAVLAGAAGMLLVLAGPLPAAADVPWPDTADCATGEFTGQATGPADRLGPFLELSGWVGPCPPDPKDTAPQVRGRYGFAYLEHVKVISPGQLFRGRLIDSRLRPYQSATGPTAFAGRFDFGMVRPDIADVSICLMRDATTRLACAIVELRLGVPTATWVPVTDPRVQGRVTVLSPGGETHPNCGTCL